MGHPLTETITSADLFQQRGRSSALQLRFSGQVFVFVQYLADSIQPPERCQMHIGECVLNLRHPAFDGPVHTNRHLAGDNLDKIRWSDCSSQCLTRLS